MLEEELSGGVLPRQAGVTLIEAMMVILVLGILLTVGVPAMNAFTEKNRLKEVAETIASDLHYARSESIKRNKNIFVSFTTDGATNWCYGLSEESTCDCTVVDAGEANACVFNTAGTTELKTAASSEFPTIRLIQTTFGGNNTDFDRVRGIAKAGTVYTQSAGGKELQIRVSPLGRVRVCSPSGSDQVGGYPSC